MYEHLNLLFGKEGNESKTTDQNYCPVLQTQQG